MSKSDLVPYFINQPSLIVDKNRGNKEINIEHNKRKEKRETKNRSKKPHLYQ